MRGTGRLAWLALVAALVSCSRERAPQDRTQYDAFRSGLARSPAPAVAPDLVRPGTRVHAEPRLGVPTFVWAAPGQRPKRSGPAADAAERGAESESVESAARAHVERYAPAYGLDASGARAARLREIHDIGRGGIIARFQQEVNGVEVFRDELKVLMTRDLELVALSGYIGGDVTSGPPARFDLDAAEAIAAAASDFTGGSIGARALRAAESRGGYARFTLDGASAASGGVELSDAVRVKPVYYRLPSGLVPSYYLEIEAPDESGSSELFSYVIAADDGRVLLRNDLASDAAFAYRVWADGSGPLGGPEGSAAAPNPTGVPDGFQAPFVAPDLVTLECGPIASRDPWLAAGSTETVGNNVEAYVDLFAPDGLSTGDFRAPVSSVGSFDWPMDFSRQPSSSLEQRQSAITQLFYTVNFFHDWYYGSGFDEVAGNAQTSNYGRGGLEGDSIRAEAHDYGGRNNANMRTPADGGRPRMQMYLFDGLRLDRIAVTAAPPPLAAGELRPVGAATFGPSTFTISGPVARAKPGDGCAPMSGVAGKIAFVDRGGECGFPQKIEAAQAAGAVGVIVGNVATSADPATPPSMGGTPSKSVSIGALSVNLATADGFRAALAAGEVRATLSRPSRIDRDGALDNQLVAHEWGHYIANRLVGNSNGLTTNLSRGLGEGWADFHALLMTARAEDVAVPGNDRWQGAYAVAAHSTPSFSSPSNSHYFGIRRYPYSTDLSKHPLTYRHVADGEPLPPASVAPVNDVVARNGWPNSQVHNTGEVWAAMLWECYAALLRDTVDDTTGRGLTFGDAQQRMKDVLVAAYKLTPMNPTLLEARDAVLAAAYAMDPVDYVLMAGAFAKRGAGALAVSPDRFTQTNKGVVEDFTPPVGLAFVAAAQTDDVSAACADDAVLQSGEQGHLTITLRNVVAGTVPESTAVLSTTTPGVVIDAPHLAFAAAPAGALVSARAAVTLGAVSGTRLDFALALTNPLGTVTVPFVVRANQAVTAGASATDDVESPSTRWTVPYGSLWQRVEASATDHRWLGPVPASAGESQLWSPPLRVGGGSFSFTFRERHQFEMAGPPAVSSNVYYDGGVVEISTDDGLTWSDVGSSSLHPGYEGAIYSGAGSPLAGRLAFVGNSPDYPAFRTVGVHLGQAFAGKTVRIRFRVAGDLYVASAGWEIDDIAFDGIVGTPFDAVTEAVCSPVQESPYAPGPAPPSADAPPHAPPLSPEPRSPPSAESPLPPVDPPPSQAPPVSPTASAVAPIVPNAASSPGSGGGCSSSSGRGVAISPLILLAAALLSRRGREVESGGRRPW